MDKNLILGNRYLNFSKYLRRIAIICFVIFIVLNAINTGDQVIALICYLLLTVTLTSAIQSIALLILGRYHLKKADKN